MIESLISDKREVEGNHDKHAEAIKLIKDSVEDPSSEFHGSSFNRLAYLVDTYGPRLWGSQSLELAIQDLY